ncbi:hypothetical protein DFR26_1562 [Paraperlucidibaca baekdonensis]|uniref:Uncharacterized protein n=1 Tax=Paraperlucidibaca baekdonensis TaxID=748120 RepID=A0A3E0H395_9GAMM|nr:hypothetical protein [Paraperlucidibaca baekdonensis]REH37779.1 hypothetical protein DFR26_1562 [Paraperlucidibaca baekdonensis]
MPRYSLLFALAFTANAHAIDADPNDRAAGYKIGELRGALTLRQRIGLT